jgi:hypothetical protein
MDCVPFTCHLDPLNQVKPSFTPVSVERLVSKNLLSGKNVTKRTVYGMMKTISPVNRNGMKSPYFLIELTDLNCTTCVPLIVQEPELLHVQQFLKLDHVYVISGLIYVLIKHHSEKTLWAATKDSVFSEFPTTLASYELNSSSNRSLSSHSYSDSFGAKRGVKRQSNHDQTQTRAKRFITDEGSTESGQGERMPQRQCDSVYPLMSYDGEITKCINAAACMYELDSKILLYICHQPCTRYGRGLRVGAKVRLTNAHLVNEKVTMAYVEIMRWLLYSSVCVSTCVHMCMYVLLFIY